MAPCEEGPLLSTHAPDAPAPPSTQAHALRERITQELAALDTEEEEYIKSITLKRLELKQLWNGSLIVNKLPNELLVQVFTFFKPHFPTPRPKKKTFWQTTGRREPLVMDWQGLMLVCGHWRDVLISTPAFWREVYLKRHTEWTALCLARSAATSLDVCVARCNHSPLDVLYSHAHRFKTFLFEAEYGPHLQAALPSLFGRGMPLLEVLDFTVGRWTPREDIDPPLSSERFPRLRTLVLSATVAPQDVSLYAQLRTLSLTCCPHKLSFDRFLDALAASVQPEELTLMATLNHLSLADKWTPGAPVSRRPPISLPRLREFTAKAHGVVCTARFLAHLHLQPSMLLSISGDVADGFPGASTTMWAMLPPNPSATLPALAMATTIDMTVQANEYAIHCQYPSPAAASKSTGFQDVDAQAVFELCTNESATWTLLVAHGLSDLAALFGRSLLTRLVVHGAHGYRAAGAWERAFRTFPLLEELDIEFGRRRRDDVLGVTAAFLGLHAASVAPRADSPISVACANLRDVRLEGVGTVETYEAMRECLWHRRGRGVVLQRLRLALLIDGLGLTSEARRAFVKDLRGAVQCVHTTEGELNEEHNVPSRLHLSLALSLLFVFVVLFVG